MSEPRAHRTRPWKSEHQNLRPVHFWFCSVRRAAEKRDFGPGRTGGWQVLSAARGDRAETLHSPFGLPEFLDSHSQVSFLGIFINFDQSAY